MTGISSKTLEARRGASSLEKMLGLLDLFTTASPAWSTEELIRVSGTSRSTCYRYIKALQAAGLLTPVAGGAWMLGPRVIELDRTMRLCDPVTAGGYPSMQRLAAQTGHTGLLCLLFSGTVMCVADARAPGAPAGLFSRGQRRPLFNGAASKVILAHLPPHQLRAIFARHRGTIAAAGLGGDWESFRHTLRTIREAGHSITQSEFLPGVLGIAAPLFNAEGGVLGSLGIAARIEEVPESAHAGLAERVAQAAREACARIAEEAQVAARPARAVG
ncbi:IclR family transcriptional regulator [Falsiroseomonas tokyonensis]|uniref:IclR family transcriptional regulator n=1 Tax=Falsiroseomonas tokyonensis TaxID=430521 RepID=A0ABV7BU72_9PROT|nr:IclR family transcriptional regulator [Falsiroseomonas tokyonensis]MBU8539220.1 IclR family transcriptional regulator [Falsiroseomonas tokyonensis]